MIVPISRPLHLSIAAGGEANSLKHDLRMVKASLLYADRATAYSVSLSLTAFFLTVLLEMDSNYREFLEYLVPSDEDLRQLTESWIQPLLEIRAAEKSGFLDVGQDLVWSALLNEGKDSRVARDAVERELALLIGPPSFKEKEVSHASTVALNKAIIDIIFSKLADGSTYPLLDNTLRDALGTAIQEANATTSTQQNSSHLPMDYSDESLARVREIQLATDLTAKLPNFETATVEELLDIRRELERPLTSFRSEVIKLAEQIRSAPWDKNFPHEVERLIRRDVEPAILHLEEDIRSNTYMAKLAYKSLKDPLEVGGATGLGFVLGSFGGAATSLLGAAAGIGVAALDVYREWKEKRQEIGRNQLYFYYEAGQRLKRSRGRLGKAGK